MSLLSSRVSVCPFCHVFVRVICPAYVGKHCTVSETDICFFAPCQVPPGSLRGPCHPPIPCRQGDIRVFGSTMGGGKRFSFKRSPFYTFCSLQEIGGIVYERTHCNLTTLLSKYRPALPFSPNGKAAADLFLSPSFGEGDRRRFGPLPRKAFPGFERYTTCRDEVAEAAGRWREELDAWSRKRMESDAHGRCAELIRKLNQT